MTGSYACNAILLIDCKLLPTSSYQIIITLQKLTNNYSNLSRLCSMSPCGVYPSRPGPVPCLVRPYPVILMHSVLGRAVSGLMPTPCPVCCHAHARYLPHRSAPENNPWVMLLTCQLPDSYNHNMCNKLLYYQSNNTDCIAENLLEIYIMSLMSLAKAYKI